MKGCLCGSPLRQSRCLERRFDLLYSGCLFIYLFTFFFFEYLSKSALEKS